MLLIIVLLYHHCTHAQKHAPRDGHHCVALALSELAVPPCTTPKSSRSLILLLIVFRLTSRYRYPSWSILIGMPVRRWPSWTLSMVSCAWSLPYALFLSRVKSKWGPLTLSKEFTDRQNVHGGHCSNIVATTVASNQLYWGFSLRSWEVHPLEGVAGFAFMHCSYLSYPCIISYTHRLYSTLSLNWQYTLTTHTQMHYWNWNLKHKGTRLTMHIYLP